MSPANRDGPTQHELESDAGIASTLTQSIAAIEIVKNFVPIALGQTILTTMSSILVILKDTIKNKEDFKDLIRQCDRIRTLFEGTQWQAQEDAMSLRLSNALGDLHSALGDIHVQVITLQHRSLLRRIWSSSIHKDKIAGWTSCLDRCIRDFSLQMNMAVAEGLHDVQRSILKTAPTMNESRSATILPPPRPAIFFGRDAMIDQISCILSSDRQERHVALLGPGGIGKTSLAKATSNDRIVVDRFKSERYFVPFDDILASQITYSIFVSRIADIIGIVASSHYNISEHLRHHHGTVLVLDNAESLLDSKNSGDASRIKSAIDELGGLPSVSILVTSRNRELPRGLMWTKLDVPSLDLSSAYKTFMAIYQSEEIVFQGSRARPVLDRLLSEVGFHPLSITLLAYVAEINAWTIDDLDRRWHSLHTQLLSSGQGKQDNFTDSIQLSLSSPSVCALGEDVGRVLRMIAFFPQGIPRQSLDTVFPSSLVSRVGDIVDCLHRHSLVFFKDGFVTMLLPIRLYISDAAPSPDGELLRMARSHYRSSLSLSHSSEQRAAFIKAEDVNAEYLFAYDLQTLPPKDLRSCLNGCNDFLLCLRLFKPRRTLLHSVLRSLNSADHSRKTNIAMMRCFVQLSYLARFHRDFSYLESLELSQLAHDLGESAGLQSEVLFARLFIANTLYSLGQYRGARGMLQHALDMEIWNDGKGHLLQRARALMLEARINHSTAVDITGQSIAAVFRKAEMLYSRTSDSDSATICIANAAVALANVDGDTEAARKTLQSAIDNLQIIAAETDSSRSRIYHLFNALAAVSLMERDPGQSKQFLSIARDQFLRLNQTKAATIRLLSMAALCITQSELQDARLLIGQAEEELKAAHGGVAPASDDCQQLYLYISGSVELAAGRLREASDLFDKAKFKCEAGKEFKIRALCARAMGEIAYHIGKDGNTYAARTFFEETAAICDEAGIPYSLLYRDCHRTEFVFLANLPPATWEGWPLFCSGRFPIT